MCSVLAGVPAVEVSSVMTVLPLLVEKVTLEGSQVAPGTPGPPELARTDQPLAEILGSVWAV